MKKNALFHSQFGYLFMSFQNLDLLEDHQKNFDFEFENSSTDIAKHIIMVVYLKQHPLLYCG